MGSSALSWVKSITISSLASSTDSASVSLVTASNSLTAQESYDKFKEDGYGYSTSAMESWAVDTTADTSILIRAVSDGTDVVTLKNHSIILIHAP